MIKGYVFKADIKKFFDSIDQKVLLNIFERKIKDKKFISLIDKVLKNFNLEKENTNYKPKIDIQLKIDSFGFNNKKIKSHIKIEDKKGMPLGNMTSQFFANIYLNELDRFIKHGLKAKYYIRYVDDFIILHKDKKILEDYQNKIGKYLKNIRLELHPEKSKIFSVYKGIDFLGFRIFYHNKLVRKRNLKHFKKDLDKLKSDYDKGLITQEKIAESLHGWFAYIIWGNTYRLRKDLVNEIRNRFPKGKLSNLDYLNKIAHL
jgi:RNA-directed DNA polymerase